MTTIFEGRLDTDAAEEAEAEDDEEGPEFREGSCCSTSSHRPRRDARFDEDAWFVGESPADTDPVVLRAPEEFRSAACTRCSTSVAIARFSSSRIARVRTALEKGRDHCVAFVEGCKEALWKRKEKDGKTDFSIGR